MDKPIAKRGRIPLAVNYFNKKRQNSPSITGSPLSLLSWLGQMVPVLGVRAVEQLPKSFCLREVAQKPEGGGPKGRLPRAMWNKWITPHTHVHMPQRQDWDSLEKVWEIESWKHLKNKHPIPGFWWLVICCDPKKKDWKGPLNHLFFFNNWQFAWMKANKNKSLRKSMSNRRSRAGNTQRKNIQVQVCDDWSSALIQRQRCGSASVFF